MPPRRRKAVRRTARASSPDLPEVGPGERLYVLDVPYGEVVPGARWSKTARSHIAVGPARGLRPELARYRPGPHTLGRFIEHSLNGTSAPATPGTGTMTPRPLQVEGARAIARRAAAGGDLFLLADDPGVGKTITAVLAALAIARIRGSQRVLVIADRPAAITIGHWARTITAIGDGGLTWVVTTWDRLSKVTGFKWDIVLADEAHSVRNTTTKRWKYYWQITRPTQKSRPFVTALTATPGYSPLELPYLAVGYAEATNTPITDWLSTKDPGKTLAHQLATQGLHVNPKGRYGPEWTEDPSTRASDLRVAKGWLADQKTPAMLFRAAPWGPVPVHGLAVDLTPTQRLAYESEWGEFVAQMQLARRGKDVAKGRAALLRFRQKAGLIRVDSTVEWVTQQVESGRQVAVSVEFVDTAAIPVTAALHDAGIKVARIYGTDPALDREAERLAFQTGAAPVAVFTVTASISLHAGEVLSAGRTATTAPRVGLFHQARFSGIAGRQITGRTHRDHQVSPWNLAFAADTVEERVGGLMVSRIAAAADMVGGDTAGLSDIAEMLGAGWLPLDSLTDIA